MLNSNSLRLELEGREIALSPQLRTNFSTLSDFSVLCTKTSLSGFMSKPSFRGDFFGVPLIEAMKHYNPAMYNAALQDIMVLPNTLNTYGQEVKRMCISFLELAQHASDFNKLYNMLEPRENGIGMHFIDGTTLLIVGETNIAVGLNLSQYYKSLEVMYVVLSDEYMKDNFGNIEHGQYWMYGLDVGGQKDCVHLNISVGNSFDLWHLDAITFPVDLSSSVYRRSACEELIDKLKNNFAYSNSITMYDDLFAFEPIRKMQREVSVNHSVERYTSSLGFDPNWQIRWESGEDERFNMKMEYPIEDLLFKSVEVCVNPFPNNYNFNYAVLKPENLNVISTIADTVHELHDQVMYTLSEKMDEIGNQDKMYANAYDEKVQYCNSIPYLFYKKYMYKERK